MVRNTALSWYDVIFVLMLERWVNQSQYDRKVSQFTHYQTFLWWRDEVLFTKWNICVMLMVGVNRNTQYIFWTFCSIYKTEYADTEYWINQLKIVWLWYLTSFDWIVIYIFFPALSSFKFELDSKVAPSCNPLLLVFLVLQYL